MPLAGVFFYYIIPVFVFIYFQVQVACEQKKHVPQVVTKSMSYIRRKNIVFNGIRFMNK